MGIAFGEDGNAFLIVKSCPNLIIRELIAEFWDDSIGFTSFELIVMGLDLDFFI
jgi:hypothetical protein